MAKPNQPIIVKKVKKAAHAHHGGAWKIAYADFVTAMMAFFLLMWLINMTTQEQKVGLADYFAPEAISPSTSGAGGVLGGTAMDDAGSKSSGAEAEPIRRALSSPGDAAMGTTGQEDGSQDHAGEARLDRRAADVQAQHSAAASIRQALQDMPEIAELSRNLVIEPTPEGLDISLVDEDGRAMFPEDSIYPYERTRLVLEAIAPTIRQMPNRIAVRGHTSAARPGEPVAVDPWSLTAGRALAVREVLASAGLSEDRFVSVIGRADTEPAFPDNPYIAPNRRVTITLLDEEPPLPPSFSP
ncbi:flagellar motor protein MotB [Salinarimonas ramus]|uniref:Chemotaxis protein MotB n=1 Tax=Salinarimonas ramus TaxID=690164 RepID=A0A917V6U3_9HYPH|nr:flagellar motor protein MotB [Salinarimonas ramus]GGK44706.1 chemotaxis protein MotB [Salinarimonas ramus]